MSHQIDLSQGGSYRIDPVTGEPVLVERTGYVPEQPAQPTEAELAFADGVPSLTLPITESPATAPAAEPTDETPSEE